MDKGSPDGLYLLFSSCNIGGAERIHAEITAAVANRRPWVVLSHPTVEPSFRVEYLRSAHRLLDLSGAWPHRARRLFAIGWLASMINRHPQPVVFGSLTEFFYRLLPHLGPHVRCVDLTHSFDGYREHWQTPYAPLLDQRVVISRQLEREMQRAYRCLDEAEDLSKRIVVVHNAVPVPPSRPPKPPTLPLQVLFVGRGTNEGGKRIRLIGEIARACRKREMQVRFVLVGPDIEECLSPDLRPFVECRGPTTSREELDAFYRDSHVLLMVSEVEGVPLAILDALAHGTIPVTTDVGAIREWVDADVGVLLGSSTDHDVLDECVRTLAALAADPSWRDRLSSGAHARARSSLSMEQLHERYSKLLEWSPRGADQ